MKLNEKKMTEMAVQEIKKIADKLSITKELSVSSASVSGPDYEKGKDEYLIFILTTKYSGILKNEFLITVSVHNLEGVKNITIYPLLDEYIKFLRGQPSSYEIPPDYDAEFGNLRKR